MGDMNDEIQNSYRQRSTQSKGFREFMWNPEKKQFMGRTGKRWAQLLLFYIVFYGLLAGAFAVFLKVFYLTRGDDRPTHNLYDDKKHPMLQEPGLGMRPRVVMNKYSPEIEFTASDSNSYSEYVDGIKDYLNNNFTSGSLTVKSCSGEDSTTCDLSRSSLGECSGEGDTSFGYSTGEPCVLLKINKIIGWVPGADVTVNVSVSCELDNTDVKQGKDNGCNNCLGSPEYYPSGFPASCFPYCGLVSSPDYFPPVVMVKFKGIATNGEKVKIFCKANVQDFEHTSDTRKDKALSTKFTFIIKQ